ncbi:MAG TPA: hypothetical protein VK982_12530, partial [Bacteroidales bacterium]|nr:hypothetical protein [Bacteroidales bacterium]
MRYLSLIILGLFFGIINFSCDKNSGNEANDNNLPKDSLVEFTIFYTNDEHALRLDATVFKE